ncbi:FCD domain-containing protein [Pseudoroseomonas wenyumeiae]
MEPPAPAAGGPTPGHPSFAEHEGIVAAIASGEAAAAQARMHDHIAAVHRIIAAG